MLIPFSRFKAAYELIHQRALDSGCSVLIFVAPSVDALAACTVLVTLLKRDQIRFTFVPVLGYEHLLEQAQKFLFDSTDFRSVVLINCGSIVDISAFLRLESCAERSAYVMDYHRPVHRANIDNTTNVVVFADSDSVPNPRPPTRQPAEDVGLDEHSGDSPNKRARSGDARDDDDDAGAARDQQQQEPAMNAADFGDDFARGSFYGTSSACLMYELAGQLASDTPRTLWLAIVGLTEHYLMHRCSVKQYLKQLQTLRHAAITSDDKTLVFEDAEFQFVLYRHWSLYSAMYHTPQVATRLGIWAEAGRRKLDQLLAKMGVPLEQCRQRYALMSADIKQDLPRKLEEYASEYGLADITFPSFVKTLDNKLRLSASDCVLAVSALIALGVPRAATATAGASASTLAGSAAADAWQAQLLQAYYALSSDNSEDAVSLTSGGLTAAVQLQEALVREGVDLLLKKVIVRNGPFRYGLLHDGGVHAALFSHTQSLTRLALFVLDALKKPNKASKPLVLCAQNRARGTYLVVGVSAAAPSTRAKRNDFGTSFHAAARMTGTDVSFHSFDSSVIEVAASDVARFLELLHSGLIAEDN